MTRKPAAERFADLPSPPPWPPTGEALANAIRALSHAGRRALLDSLAAEGPASVGQLARRVGMAPGSASHHLRVLATAGLIVAAPELAGDTRESWWRSEARSLTWSPQSFADGTAGAELARLAGRANLDYLLERARQWQRRRDADPWRGGVSDCVVAATEEQLKELTERLSRTIAEWSEACSLADGDAPTRPVRAIVMAFPEARHG